MLPVAFAASVKNEDHVDNSFAFVYDTNASEIVAATSSKRFDFDDDVDFSVMVNETDEGSLVGQVRFNLLSKRAVRYEGTVHFRVRDISGALSYSEDRDVSFTLRRAKGQRSQRLTFPFTVPSGEYKVGVTFSD